MVLSGIVLSGMVLGCSASDPAAPAETPSTEVNGIGTSTALTPPAQPPGSSAPSPAAPMPPAQASEMQPVVMPPASEVPAAAPTSTSQPAAMAVDPMPAPDAPMPSAVMPMPGAGEPMPAPTAVTEPMPAGTQMPPPMAPEPTMAPPPPAVPALPQRVLLYHNNPGAGVNDIDDQVASIRNQLSQWDVEADLSTAAGDINDDNLKKYGAVALINPCFNAFGNNGTSQAEALEKFVEAGGGLWGTHCASVTYRNANPPHPYNQLLGGRGGDGFFDGDSACRKLGDHPTNALLPDNFDYDGNLDNTDFLADDITVLVRCKWSGRGQRDVVVSWTREPGEGRIFFSNFAKLNNDLVDPALADTHLWPGLAWVLRLQ